MVVISAASTRFLSFFLSESLRVDAAVIRSQGWLAFTGRTMQEELGDGWAERVHAADLDRCLDTYSSSFYARRGFLMEYRMRRADGEYRWLLDNDVPRFKPGGGFAGYIGSCVDITDVKRTQEENLAKQKLESVGTFAGGIAHDFNNLLGGILAHSELALTDLPNGSRPEVELQRIRTAALRGAEIVRQLMIYAGQETEVLEPVDVSRIVEDMIELLKVSVSKHAVLETDLGEDLPAVRATPGKLRQLVMNLITNASEAIGNQDGVIRVSTRRVAVGRDSAAATSERLAEGDYLELEVSDTGRGMTPEMQARIFDPFFTTKLTGHGLGLAVVMTRETTILIVEDETLLRDPVSAMLRKRGLSVLEASDGSTALELIRAHKDDIDVVLLDITLPGASSRDVIEETRRLRPGLPVIVTSANSEEMAATSLANRVERFIRKPFKVGDLMDMIREGVSS
jgi:two-component system, cell cycle sensor histidine kinase and response regulator CckA